MKIYTRTYNTQLGQVVTTESEIDVVFQSAVNTIADLPTDDADNTVRFVFDINHLFCRVGGEWVDQGVFDFSDLIAERIMQELS